jgi:hypothetical protein
MRTVHQVGSLVAKHKFWLLALGMGLLPGCTNSLRQIFPGLF